MSYSVKTNIVSSVIREGIIAGTGRNVPVMPLPEGGTKFEITMPRDGHEALEKETPTVPVANPGYALSPFHRQLKQHLAAHFANISNLQKTADAHSRRDGVFLKKVNAIIMAHLDEEGFDIAGLARAMAMSRTQLHRRLKALIGFAPARYIRYVRLQKAKEWLEKEDLTVGEAAFRTGFVSLSHFTRSFREQFGFNPSELRHNWKGGNNRPK